MGEVLEFFVDRMETPVGEMVVVTDAAGKVTALDWSDFDPRLTVMLDRYYGKGRYSLAVATETKALRDVMARYFAGEVTAIDEIEVATSAGTEFQRSVWEELRRIPGGAPISYGTLAERIARPKAVRAVGMANGSNPIGLIVPCHRVIGADGSLTGYGGGLPRKKWLLEHEGKNGSLFVG